MDDVFLACGIGSFSTGSPEDSRFQLLLVAPNADLSTYYYSKLILTRKPEGIGEGLAKQKKKH